MGKSKDEYLMLREEILHLDTVVNNTINFFYAFMATYLAFALTRYDTVFILLSYIIMIPAYLIILSKMKGMSKIGAYLKVFYEGQEFNWETRNLKYIEDNNQIMIPSNFPFVFVNIAVFALILYHTKWTTPMACYESVKIILAIVMFVSLMILTLKNRNINTRSCLEKWEKIKLQEKAAGDIDQPSK